MFHKKLPLLIGCGLFSFSSLIAENENIAHENLPAAHTTGFKAFTGKVIGNRVRMRVAPTIESQVVRETAPGEMFAVVGEEKGFYVVQPSRASHGYVFRTFVLDGIVEGDRVNIRMSPDQEAPIIGRLNSGEKVNASVCEANNKWLEIQLPKSVHFYIAKEFIEHAGEVDMIAQVETRQDQAYHVLGSAFHAAQAEIQKPFDEIAIENVHNKFSTLIQTYSDMPDIVTKAKEAENAIEEAYIQKKIAFLESKADRTVASRDLEAGQLQKLSQLGAQLRDGAKKESAGEIGKAASNVLGHSLISGEMTDKMMVWNSLEESLYHLWAVTNEGKTIYDFYEEESVNATVLTGIVEPFNKPVKNRPGDYILRSENMPVGFLYSTRVNLHELVGKKVTLATAPRPNNNFAFPAYFVLSVE